jgi:sigma-B regulation protein RsbU (phosphoserine phosphatase)
MSYDGEAGRAAVNTDPSERIFELESRLESKKAELADLATMGAVITSIHEIDSVLTVVMDMAVRLVNGEVGAILLEDQSDLKVKISWGISEEFVHTLQYQDDMDLAAYCFKSGETVVLNELGLVSENGLQIESIICTPIKTSDSCYGVMMIINKSGGESWSGEDRESLEMLLSFVAVAIDNSRLMSQKLHSQKIEQEMSIARQVQGTILPSDIDDIEGARIGAVYFPAREVGGDFYDIIQLGNQSFLAVLGDVSSKGVPAALVMSAAVGIIKSVLSMRPDIEVSELASELNATLAEGIIKDREMFVTLFLCKFDLANNVLTYCNAGHLPGLFWDERARQICSLADGGSIVGQFPEINFKQGQRELRSGDKLFLFTDGLTEAADVNGVLFGTERAEQVFTAEIGLEPKEFCLKVKEWVDKYALNAPEDYIDDFTIMQIMVE